MEVKAYKCQGLVGVGLSQAFMFCLLHCLRFLLPLSFTLFSDFCPELELHMGFHGGVG